jgi:hypothetical protein
MKASFVAYDHEVLHKMSELKKVKYGYVIGCPKRSVTQIRSLESLGVKMQHDVNNDKMTPQN